MDNIQSMISGGIVNTAGLIELATDTKEVVIPLSKIVGVRCGMVEVEPRDGWRCFESDGNLTITYRDDQAPPSSD